MSNICEIEHAIEKEEWTGKKRGDEERIGKMKKEKYWNG